MRSSGDGEARPLVVNVEDESLQERARSPSGIYKTYKSRWIILGILALLNVSNAMNWLSFAPVANAAKEYYGVGEFCITALSLAFFALSIPIGFFGSWLLDVYDLRVGIWVGAWLNAIGAIVRYLSRFGRSYPIVIVGQMLCAAAQPFILFAPTKLASFWFPDDQRALATMLSTMANPLGVGIANLASPAIVNVTEGADDSLTESFERMLWIYAVPSCAGALLTSLCVWKSRPPTPPSFSAGEGSQNNFWSGLKKVYKFKSYLILMLSWSIGVGLFNAFQTFLEQMLCIRGYTDSFSGLCGALLIFGGIPGAVATAVFVDRTRRFGETLKVVFIFAVICQFWFVGVMRLENEKALIAASLSSFGFFALALMPVWLELGVECTYPDLSEATSSGLLWIAGQIMGIVFVGLAYIPGLTTKIELPIPNQCNVNTKNNTKNGSLSLVIGTYNHYGNQTYNHYGNQTVSDLTNFGWCTCGISLAICFIMIAFFWPTYRRLEAETKAKAEASATSGSEEITS